MTTKAKWGLGILLLGIIISISLLYAEQYAPECHQTIIAYSFDFWKLYVIEPFLYFAKNCSWAFLVLLLFLLPSCREVVYLIIERLGTHIVAYGKASHPTQEVSVIEQTAQEQKEFKKEQKEEIKGQAKDAKEEPSSFRSSLKNYERLKEFAKEKIQERNIENYIENTKLLVTNDPVILSGTLLFDCSYRYKGEKSARCYINTLIIRNSPVYQDSSKLYRYIRIMDDINKSKRNQRYCIEIIILNVSENTFRTPTLRSIAEKFKPAIDSGILILREYALKGGKPEIVDNAGWMED